MSSHFDGDICEEPLRCPSCDNTAINGNHSQGYTCPDCGYFWTGQNDGSGLET